MTILTPFCMEFKPLSGLFSMVYDAVFAPCVGFPSGSRRQDIRLHPCMPEDPVAILIL